MDNKQKDYLKISNRLFSEEKRYFIEKLVHSYGESLLSNTDYYNKFNKMADLDFDLKEYFDEGQIKILDKYLNYFNDCQSYIIALAYYLGRTEIKDIRDFLD